MADYQYKDTGERIKKIRKFLGLSQQEFADTLDTTRFNCSDMEAGKSSVTANTAKKLSDVHNISLDWLYNGKGAMVYEDNIRHDSLPAKTQIPILSEVEPINLPALGRVNVIELEQSALASFCIDMEEDTRVAREAFMPGLPERSAPYYAIKVEGDSMLPHLNSGDWLYCEHHETRPIKPQTLYAIILKGVVLVKWLLWEDAPDDEPDGSQITLISANQNYPPFKENMRDVRAILRVVAVLKVV